MFRSIQVVAVCGVLCLSNGVSAKEIDEGTIELEGGFGVSYSSYDRDVSGSSSRSTNSSFGVDLSLLAYAHKNFAVGMIVNREKSDGSSSYYSSSASSYSLGPQIMFNESLNTDTNLFMGVSYVKTSSTVNSSSTTWDIDGAGWNIQAGIKKFITDSVSLNTGVNYFNVTSDYGSYEIESKGFAFGSGISVYF